MHHVGVIAYGSLITSPGSEIVETIVRTRPVVTPFRVEFARASDGRGGAPTLVPVEVGGAEVHASLLLLDDTITLQEARDYVYRREIGRIGDRDRHYVHRDDPGPNQVHLPVLIDFGGVDFAIYTSLGDTIPVEQRTGLALAERAICSVSRTETGNDGITYLRDAIAAGVATPLTDDYRKAILEVTQARTLEDALATARTPRHRC